MNAPATPAKLRLARRLVRVVDKRGAIREEEIAGLLGCGWAEARTATGIALQWRKVDRCGNFLVACSSGEGGEEA